MTPPNPNQIYVPVRVEGNVVRDNGGDVVAVCANHRFAEAIARLVNAEAGVVPHPR